MTFPGALPTVEIADDYLEAPSSEPTILGGWDFRPTHSLEEALEHWHRSVWGGQS